MDTFILTCQFIVSILNLAVLIVGYVTVLKWIDRKFLQD